MHLGDGLAALNAVAALLQATHADGVIDVLLLREPARAESKRRHADVDSADRGDVAARRRSDLANDRRRRKRVLGRVTALRGNPALVQA